MNEAMNDAPREDDIEPEHWDADRVRLAEDRPLKHGARLYSVAAATTPRGEFAALSQLLTDPQVPDWGHQGLTAVTAAAPGPPAGPAGQGGYATSGWSTPSQACAGW